MSLLASQEPASSTVRPGADEAVHTVRVRNTGDTVEEYQLSVVGPLAAWAALSPDVLRLYPGDDATATVTFAIPRTVQVAAGPTPFGVRVVPRVHPELGDVAEGSVTVAPFLQFEADMTPVTVQGRMSAPLRPTVENLGNAPLEVRLVGRDDEDALQFDEQAPLVVPSGTTGRPVVRVRPRRRKFTGSPDRFPFTLTVTPDRQAEAAGAVPAQLRGTFVRLALVPTWLLVLLVLLLLAGLVLGGVAYLARAGFGQPAPVAAPPVPEAAPPPAAPPSEAAPTDDEEPEQDEEPPPAQDEQGRPEGTVTIERGGRALTASSTEGRAGAPAPVTQEAGREAARQRWDLLWTESGGAVIVAGVDDGRALDQPETGDDRPLVLGAFDGESAPPSQVWELRDAGSGTAVVNAGSGYCLTDRGDGRTVVAARCEDDASQIWTIDNP